VGIASWLGFKPNAPVPQAQVSTRPMYDLIPEGMSLDEYLKSRILGQSVEKLWREQPHLRTVVGFVSRNIAQLGLHVFERDAEDGRNRVRGGVLVDLLDEPNAEDTQFDLLEATVASRMLYDETYWWVGRDLNAPSGWVIRHIPTSWVIGMLQATAFTVGAYKVAIPNTSGRWVEIPAQDVIKFKGWSPADPKSGTSPVHALKAILAEQVHAAVFRDQMWQRGGRVGTFLSRPTGAPDWSQGEKGKTPRDRFIEQWQNNYAGDRAANAGGTPLLEDGMELKSNRFSAKDEQYVESSKLSLETCAQVYHINPTMIGLLDNANYSNVQAFRQMLYSDNLGPEIERIQQRIDKQLVPRLADKRTTYVEFNLQAKLAGSFLEQSDLLARAIGGPYMTTNEGRARLNMSKIDGGDALIRPLNVTQNGDQNPIPAEPSGDQQQPPSDPATKESTNGPRNGNRVHAHY
jgi:HK97 family phage portal protein